MNFETFWEKASRFISFWAGLGIMVYETVVDQGEKPWLYAAALGMMGLPVAKAAEEVLSRFSSHGPSASPPEQQKQMGMPSAQSPQQEPPTDSNAGEGSSNVHNPEK